MLLTGTPLQNCLAELLALLQYVLPAVPLREDLLAAEAAGTGTGPARLDRGLVARARDLLEACMIRRVKADVEASLRPKIEYVLRPPLTRLQRKWYRSFLEDNGEAAAGMLTKQQLMSKLLQCGCSAIAVVSLVPSFVQHGDLIPHAFTVLVWQAERWPTTQ